MMNSPNLGWLFYKDYFSAIEDWSSIDSSTQAIQKKVDDIIKKTPKIEESEPLGNIHFKATTTYPGLLIGSGYIHELPDIDAQAILGFDFDYTSGLPIIRGSSIKGVLRSAFKHWKYIAHKLDNRYSKEEIAEIESNIFDNGDIFFDATVVKYGTKLLGDDYITPHGDNPLANPIPLRFIKVMPNVTFRFDFELSDFKKDDKTILTKNQKAILFGEILSDLGIGAKTNLGYGRFDEKLSRNNIERQLKENEERQNRAKEEEERQKRLNSLSPLQRKIEEIPLENGSRVAPLLRAIESGEFDENKKEALEELKKLMIKERVWVEESKAKNPKKDKKHQRTIKVIEMMRAL